MHILAVMLPTLAVQPKFILSQVKLSINLTFISQLGEAACVASEPVTHVAEVPLDFTDSILHKSCLIVAATFIHPFIHSV